jgi:hypothetical protein
MRSLEEVHGGDVVSVSPAYVSSLAVEIILFLIHYLGSVPKFSLAI